MKFTRARDLAAIGLVVLVLVYLFVREAYDSLPPMPTLAGVTLLVLAVIDALLGFAVRAKIRHPDRGRPMQPLTAVRAVVLAKASSVLGAIMLGAWLGMLAYVFPRRIDIQAAARDTPSAIIGAVCAVALIAAGLWLEYCCRTPKDRDENGATPDE